jgi:hypothetical protein
VLSLLLAVTAFSVLAAVTVFSVLAAVTVFSVLATVTVLSVCAGGCYCGISGKLVQPGDIKCIPEEASLSLHSTRLFVVSMVLPCFRACPTTAIPTQREACTSSSTWFFPRTDS